MDLDDADRDWLATVTPQGAIPTTFIAVVAFIDTDGDNKWRVYDPGDGNITTGLGLLELAKLELIARTDTGLPVRYPE